MATDPGGHLGRPSRIGGPLPVLYVDLVAWFYPGAGDGELRLSTWRDDGSTAPTYEHVFARQLAPFSADIEIPRMSRLWVTGVRKMTGWAHLGTLDGDDSDAGSGEPS